MELEKFLEENIAIMEDLQKIDINSGNNSKDAANSLTLSQKERDQMMNNSKVYENMPDI